MARYSGSVFGTIKGQASGVVAASWKGIDYIRQYVIPSNPQSTAQTLQRTKFKNVAGFARRIVDSVLNPYTLPAPKKQSAFNYFLSKNVPLQTGLTILYSLIKLVFGSLYFSLTNITASEASDSFTATWDETLIGEATNADLIVLVCYDPTNDAFGLVSTDRNTSPLTEAMPGITFVSGRTYHFWAFAVKADGTSTSESVYDEVVAGA